MKITISKDFPDLKLTKGQVVSIPSALDNGTIREPLNGDKNKLWFKKRSGEVIELNKGADYSETEVASSEKPSEISGSYMSNRKFSGAGFTLGFLYGLYYANKNNKVGFWTYVGHGLMFGAVGTASGIIVDKIIEK